MMSEEVYVKLCRIAKLDLGPEMDVAEFRNDGRFCLRHALRTKLSQMFLLPLKEIRGLSVQMTDKGILSSEILANKGDSRVFSSVILRRAKR